MLDKQLKLKPSLSNLTPSIIINIWMARNSYKDVRRLNKLHYGALRIVAKDYRQTMSRQTLDEIGRARPITWYKFSTTSLVIKVMTRKESMRLSSMLTENIYTER